MQSTRTSTTTARHLFAMRRSGVRIPSAPQMAEGRTCFSSGLLPFPDGDWRGDGATAPLGFTNGTGSSQGLGLTGLRVECEARGAGAVAVVSGGTEGEEVGQGSGLLVEGVVAHPPGVPVVLDEPEDRGLVGDRVVDEVAFGERRDDEQRLPWTVATPVQVAAGDPGGVGATGARPGQRIIGLPGLVDDRRHLVVVPAVAVVVGNDHGGVLPLG